MGATLVVRANILADIVKKLPEAADAIIAKAAFDMEAEAKALIVSQDIIDTGQLLNSGNTKQLAPMRWMVSFPTDHSIYPEFGTVYQPARPYLTPAAHHTAATLADRFKELESRLAE